MFTFQSLLLVIYQSITNVFFVLPTLSTKQLSKSFFLKCYQAYETSSCALGIQINGSSSEHTTTEENPFLDYKGRYDEYLYPRPSLACSSAQPYLMAFLRFCGVICIHLSLSSEIFMIWNYFVLCLQSTWNASLQVLY